MDGTLPTKKTTKTSHKRPRTAQGASNMQKSPRALRANAVGRRLENMNGPLTEGDRQMRPFCIGHSQQRAGNSSAIMELCQCNPVTQFAWISSTCNTAVRTCLARSPRKSKAIQLLAALSGGVVLAQGGRGPGLKPQSSPFPRSSTMRR